MFGNTQLIAKAVAEGLARHGKADLIEVSQATGPLPADLSLLIIGGPTHAFGMSRAKTRESAAQQGTGPLISPGEGIREWLENAPKISPQTLTASFDTKIAKPAWLPGSAARSAMKRLERFGLPIAAPPESFYVNDTTGPLADGELARAQLWGDTLGSLAARKASTSSGITP